MTSVNNNVLQQALGKVSCWIDKRSLQAKPRPHSIERSAALFDTGITGIFLIDSVKDI